MCVYAPCDCIQTLNMDVLLTGLLHVSDSHHNHLACHHFEASSHFTTCTVEASVSLPSTLCRQSREVISYIDFTRKHPS